MRKIIVIIYLLFSLSAFAEDYQIFSLEQDVYYKSENADWLRAKKRTLLNGEDSLKIKSGASVKLLEISTGQIYEWDKQGIFEVYDITEECLRRKSDWLNRLFSTLIENVSNEPVYMWYSTGQTKRGRGTNSILEHALAVQLKKCCYGMISPSPSLVLSKVKSDNNAYFEISNNTSDTLYVNVLAVNVKQKSFTVLYQIRKDGEWMVLPSCPGSTLVMEDFPISESRKYRYLVFGTRTPISIDPLEYWLEQKDLEDNFFIRDEEIIIGGSK
ncbi:MAG: hypothetical protein MJY96_00685 [Bacteroidaceae bacterium]|nr:hypothetical protein [Bacteroidaceae bacterium]